MPGSVKKIYLLLTSHFLFFAFSFAQVTTNGGSGLAANYPSLELAINALNAAIINSPVTITLLSGQTVPAAGYTITARGDAVNAITIRAGANVVVTGTVSTALFTLDGAAYVAVEGSITGGSSKDLVVRNTNPAGVSILFINGAVHNTVSNTIVEGTSSAVTKGVVFFSTSTTAGNSNNLLYNCTVRDRSDAAGMPANAIYAAGTNGLTNANNTISNCHVFNFTNAGILLDAIGTGNEWNITGNSLYHTVNGTTDISYIKLMDGYGHHISQNYIGGSAPQAGGTYHSPGRTFTGIYLKVLNAVPTEVQGNVIRNIRSYFFNFEVYGIYVVTGRANIGNVQGNYIGSADISQKVEMGSFLGHAIDVIGTGKCLVNNNTVNNWGTIPYPDFYRAVYGILVQGSGDHEVHNNTVMNLVNTSAASYNLTSTTGLFIGGSGNVSVKDNLIHDLTGGAPEYAPGDPQDNWITGIEVRNTSAGSVFNNNTIYNLRSIDLLHRNYIVGVQNLGGGIFSNNRVSLTNTDASGSVYGILDQGYQTAAPRYLHNTVNIYGVTNGPSFAYSRSYSSAPYLRNNIFSNQSTGSPAFALSLDNTSNWTATTSDHNVFYTLSGSPARWGGPVLSLAAFQSASGGDLYSLDVQPLFVSNTDLHLTTNNCSIDSKGLPVNILTDMDEELRSVENPDIGADEFTADVAATPAAVTGTTWCDTRLVGTTGTGFTAFMCNRSATVIPSGSNPVTGYVKTCTYIDPVLLPVYNAAPYLQRHFDIEPATGASTATATVILYFTQPDFDAYNSNNGTWPDLPTGPADAAGIAHLRVMQYHGTANSDPSLPNQYTAGTSINIDPADASISWNGSSWEVRLEVTGFSGFYVHTNQLGALPITMNYIRGSKQGNNHLLNWKVTCNSTPKATLTLERSANGNGPFAAIYTIDATAARCNQPFDYSDAQPLNGMNYYRVQMKDADGKISYSSIVALLNATKGFEIVSIAPNPVVSSHFKLNLTSANAGKVEIMISDVQGRMVQRRTIAVGAGFSSVDMNVSNLAPGVYGLTGMMGERRKVVRFVKQ